MVVAALAFAIGLVALFALARRTRQGPIGTLVMFLPLIVAIGVLVWRNGFVEGPDIIGVFVGLPAGLILGFVVASFMPWPASSPDRADRP